MADKKTKATEKPVDDRMLDDSLLEDVVGGLSAPAVQSSQSKLNAVRPTARPIAHK